MSHGKAERVAIYASVILYRTRFMRRVIGASKVSHQCSSAVKAHQRCIAFCGIWEFVASKLYTLSRSFYIPPRSHNRILLWPIFRALKISFHTSSTMTSQLSGYSTVSQIRNLTPLVNNEPVITVRIQSRKNKKSADLSVFAVSRTLRDLWRF